MTAVSLLQQTASFLWCETHLGLPESQLSQDLKIVQPVDLQEVSDIRQI